MGAFRQFSPLRGGAPVFAAGQIKKTGGGAFARDSGYEKRACSAKKEGLFLDRGPPSAKKAFGLEIENRPPPVKFCPVKSDFVFQNSPWHNEAM